MRTSKIQNGRQGAPKWLTGSGKGSTPCFLSLEPLEMFLVVVVGPDFWSLFTIPTKPLLFPNFTHFLTHYAYRHYMPLYFAKLILMLDHAVPGSDIDVPLMWIDNCTLVTRAFDS